MPLPIDVRAKLASVRYEDIRRRVQLLAELREHLGPRRAIVTSPGPVRLRVARFFTAFSEAEGLDVTPFAGEDAAMTWLRAQA